MFEIFTTSKLLIHVSGNTDAPETEVQVIQLIDVNISFVLLGGKKALQQYTSFNVMLTVTKKCDVYIYERKQIYSFFINISCFFASPCWVKQWKNWLFKIENNTSCKTLKVTNKRLQKRHYFSFPSLFLSAVQQWCLLLLKSNKDNYKNATQQHVLTPSV